MFCSSNWIIGISEQDSWSRPEIKHLNIQTVSTRAPKHLDTPLKLSSQVHPSNWTIWISAQELPSIWTLHSWLSSQVCSSNWTIWISAQDTRSGPRTKQLDLPAICTRAPKHLDTPLKDILTSSLKQLDHLDIRTRAPEHLDTPFMAIRTSLLKQLDNLGIRTRYLVKTKDQATGPSSYLHKSSQASGHSTEGYPHKFTQATGPSG
jgi:hypothetical protein